MLQGSTRSLMVMAQVVGLAIAVSAEAQAPRASVDVPVSPGTPDYHDPATGRVWTPANVGGVSSPNTPADRAFDPLAQAQVVEGTVIQSPMTMQLGTVPITAGPTVPVVSIANPSLQAVPGQRWQMVMYLSNNSDQTVNRYLPAASPKAVRWSRRHVRCCRPLRAARASVSRSMDRRPIFTLITPGAR